jgi:hypothetical protein
MLKYVSKFLLDILPSVIATVIGAYIVNHYVIPRNGSEAPKAAAHSVTEPVAPNHVDQRATDMMRKPESAAAQDAKAVDPSKSKPAVEKAEKATERPSEKPLEAARENPKPATEGKRWTSRERPVAKSVAPAAPAPSPTEAAPVPDRDVNELARAAIERLRPPPAPREAARSNEPAPVPETREQATGGGAPSPNSVAAAPQPSQPQPSQPRPFVQPLPPPVDVSTSNAVNVEGLPPAAATAKSADANRLVPPADIPPPKPLDLQAAAGPSKSSVTEDVLSAARSVINAVVPQ